LCVGIVSCLIMSWCGWDYGEFYKDHFVSKGVYCCSKCNAPLFKATEKYEHSSPWPAFTNPYDEKESLSKRQDGGPSSLKVSCKKCGNGLGHEFLGDGPQEGQSRF